MKKFNLVLCTIALWSASGCSTLKLEIQNPEKHSELFTTEKPFVIKRSFSTIKADMERLALECSLLVKDYYHNFDYMFRNINQRERSFSTEYVFISTANKTFMYTPKADKTKNQYGYVIKRVTFEYLSPLTTKATVITNKKPLYSTKIDDGILILDWAQGEHNLCAFNNV